MHEFILTDEVQPDWIRAAPIEGVVRMVGAEEPPAQDGRPRQFSVWMDEWANSWTGTR